MLKAEYERPLDGAVLEAKRWLGSLDQRPVRPDAGAKALLMAFDEELPFKGESPEAVVRMLAERAGPGLIATGSGRFHGWVVGGALPAGDCRRLGSERLGPERGHGGDRPPPRVRSSRSRSRWILELLGLPDTCSVGFVTGGQMANTVCLAAARDYVLAAHGWDVEADGLIGAPPITIVVGEERHSSIDRALRFLGLGSAVADH